MPWVPDPKDDIGLNEPIARRIYDEPMLVGAVDQGPFPGIRVQHFEETRDRELSLDRCGRTSVENGVIGYLMPRATAMGDTFKPPKVFSGWLYVRARDLIKPGKGPEIKLVASPEGGDGLKENKYHAHIQFPDGVDSYYMALSIREIYSKSGKSITPRQKRPKQWRRLQGGRDSYIIPAMTNDVRVGEIPPWPLLAESRS